ncbi:MAG TPA: hypothetical protein ENJ43_06395 [Gammaproteobacteria bacterium]|nr:hypothetical protein [Gammaproteobacteria bacterium]
MSRGRRRSETAGLGAGVPRLWKEGLFILLSLASFSVTAARLFDYTHRSFTLTGGLGLRYEDYDYNTGSVTSYSRRTLEEELKLGSTGFVWDPRFLLFDAGITLRNRDTAYHNGDSDIDTLGYRITTTWFRERNPFVLYAYKSTNTYSPRTGPSYEFINSNYGFRWRVASRLLGMVRFGYDRGRTQSDNSNTVRLDEYKDSVNVEGKRTFGKVYKIHSTVHYGYRYDNSEDDQAGRYYRQNYWYVQDNTKFSERVNLRAGFTYYDRFDKLRDGFNGNVNEIDSSHANLNMGLNVVSSDKLSHYYNLGASFNGVNSSRVDNYNMTAGVNYRFAEYWSSNGALLLVGTSSDGGSGSADYDRSAWGAKGGVAYTRSYGRTSARAGYSAGFEFPLSSSYSEDTIVTHSLHAGYSRRWSPRYNDSLSYRLNYQSGSRYESASRERIEHNINYSVNSRLAGGDSIRTALNFRDWRETSSGQLGIDNSNRTIRGDIYWTHRFWERHRLAVSAGIGDTTSGSRGRIADYAFWYSQARISMRPWRRLGLTALARYEDRSGDTSNLGPRLTLESNLNYTLAKWQVRLQYRYHDADYEAGAYQDSWLTLYLTRNFGIRF